MDPEPTEHHKRPVRPARPDESALAVPRERLAAGVDADQVVAARIQVRRDLVATQERLDELLAFTARPSRFALGPDKQGAGKQGAGKQEGGEEALDPKTAEQVDRAVQRCVTLSRLLEGPEGEEERVGEHLVHEARLLLSRRGQ